MADADLPQLRALLAVVDEGSFEGAAVALHLTQSAVSQRIRALETAVGQVLVRRTRPAGVTDAGAVYLRLARQVLALSDEARAAVTAGATSGRPVLPIAVNSDSLGTWVLPALAPLADEIVFDLHREDQDHSADLLREGAVVAAITTAARPVQGCTSHRLGVLRYRPMVAADRAAALLPDGPTPAGLAAAPLVVFDKKDDLQDRYLRGRGADPLLAPRHHVPSSADFALAVRLGLGWGMLPEADARAGEEDGTLVDLDPGRHVDVVLHWQQWTVRTAALERTGAAVRAAAAAYLR
ncbi:ArgP/LysG family DNA-binding transcriptional regulator [Cellulomonas pakistanensis]|uniref:Transcriptional regulator ArgP n=1 Tax=Cellulomonas pakistanensis TaxID=992287 RepID=A0A919U8B2_9CELL|nr:ArgP/LysG family DNA-binding transcriptional regulator [Cellulomonas pakistanensis]GIG37782.1 transcriptional regulator ArgP [Cellulomonas pakistanensis]